METSIILIKGQTINYWKNWLKEELEDDGRKSMVFHPVEGEKIYRHIVSAFIEALSYIK